MTRAAAGSPVVRAGEPPRGGPGSSTEAWRAYAKSVGLDVPSDARRGEIIAAVDEGPGGGWHPLARDWYESLADSGQSVFYEPSDWTTARVLAEVLSKALLSDQLSGAVLQRWQAGATELMTTEGARRRLRVELERTSGSEETPTDVSELDEYRRRRGSG